MALTQIKAAALTADLIDETKLADNSIDSEHYNDGSIDTAHIADDQITTAKVAAGNITATELATDAVTGAKIAVGAINNANKLQDSIVTGAKIGSGTIEAGNIATNGITTAKITDANVTTAKIADGAVTSAKLASGAGGKILQVVQTTKTDTFSTSSSSYTDVTGLSVDITPSSSSNKVLVMLDIKIGSAHEDAAYAGRLMRDSTGIYTGDSGGVNRTVATFGTSRQSGNAGYDVIQDRQAIFLDSPNTTNATTYKVQVVCNNSRDTYVNRTHDDGDTVDTPRVASSITVMEVAA